MWSRLLSFQHTIDVKPGAVYIFAIVFEIWRLYYTRASVWVVCCKYSIRTVYHLRKQVPIHRLFQAVVRTTHSCLGYGLSVFRFKIKFLGCKNCVHPVTGHWAGRGGGGGGPPAALLGPCRKSQIIGASEFLGPILVTHCQLRPLNSHPPPLKATPASECCSFIIVSRNH